MTKEEFENTRFGSNMECYYLNDQLKLNNDKYKIVAVDFCEGLVELSKGGDDDYSWVKHENIRVI